MSNQTTIEIFSTGVGLARLALDNNQPEEARRVLDEMCLRLDFQMFNDIKDKLTDKGLLSYLKSADYRVVREHDLMIQIEIAGRTIRALRSQNLELRSELVWAQKSWWSKLLTRIDRFIDP